MCWLLQDYHPRRGPPKWNSVSSHAESFYRYQSDISSGDPDWSQFRFTSCVWTMPISLDGLTASLLPASWDWQESQTWELKKYFSNCHILDRCALGPFLWSIRSTVSWNEQNVSPTVNQTRAYFSHIESGGRQPRVGTFLHIRVTKDPARSILLFVIFDMLDLRSQGLLQL